MNIKKTAIIIAPVCAVFLFCAASAKLSAQTSQPSLSAALSAPIVTIAGKTDMPAGARPQDYVSNSGPVGGGDYARLWAFFDNTETLASAWRANHDAAAAKRAGEWLRAWLITPATRMNPDLNYAASLADGRGLGRIISNINDLDNSPALTAADKEALHSWFNTYLEWLMTSKSGMAARAAQNSDGTWFVAQALPIAIYAGRDYLAHALAEEAQKRIAVQIMRDGSQPQELQRADSLTYSVFNLEAYAQIAKAAALLGVDIWNYISPGHSSLGRAVDFLAPYNTDPSKWTRPQKAQLQPGFLTPLVAARNAAAAHPVPAATVHLKESAPLPPPSQPAPVVAAVAPAPVVSQPPAPSFSAAPAAPAATGQIATGGMTIVLQKDGAILFNGKKVSTKQLADMLPLLQTMSGDIPVLVKTEPDAPLQTLPPIMDACRKAGFTKVTVQTQ